MDSRALKTRLAASLNLVLTFALPSTTTSSIALCFIASFYVLPLLSIKQPSERGILTWSNFVALPSSLLLHPQSYLAYQWHRMNIQNQRTGSSIVTSHLYLRSRMRTLSSLFGIGLSLSMFVLSSDNEMHTNNTNIQERLGSDPMVSTQSDNVPVFLNNVNDITPLDPFSTFYSSSTGGNWSGLSDFGDSSGNMLVGGLRYVEISFGLFSYPYSISFSSMSTNYFDGDDYDCFYAAASHEVPASNHEYAGSSSNTVFGLPTPPFSVGSPSGDDNTSGTAYLNVASVSNNREWPATISSMSSELPTVGGALTPPYSPPYDGETVGHAGPSNPISLAANHAASYSLESGLSAPFGANGGFGFNFNGPPMAVNTAGLSSASTQVDKTSGQNGLIPTVPHPAPAPSPYSSPSEAASSIAAPQPALATTRCQILNTVRDKAGHETLVVCNQDVTLLAGQGNRHIKACHPGLSKVGQGKRCLWFGCKAIIAETSNVNRHLCTHFGIQVPCGHCGKLFKARSLKGHREKCSPYITNVAARATAEGSNVLSQGDMTGSAGSSKKRQSCEEEGGVCSKRRRLE